MRITPERSRAIFGNPSAPTRIWEEQFDGNDADLRRLVKQDWRTVTGNEIWCYLYDLAYVELQPNLFQYLFPLCLNFWYDTLMRNEGAETGIDFHYSIHQGKILDKMLTPDQREAVLHFFYDGFIDRIEAERGFVYDGTNTPAYGWLQRFNSLGYIAPVIGPIWLSWWKLDSPGKAVSSIMYASGLVYLQGENPIFAAWTPDGGGGRALSDGKRYVDFRCGMVAGEHGLSGKYTLGRLYPGKAGCGSGSTSRRAGIPNGRANCGRSKAPGRDHLDSH